MTRRPVGCGVCVCLRLLLPGALMRRAAPKCISTAALGQEADITAKQKCRPSLPLVFSSHYCEFRPKNDFLFLNILLALTFLSNLLINLGLVRECTVVCLPVYSAERRCLKEFRPHRAAFSSSQKGGLIPSLLLSYIDVSTSCCCQLRQGMSK